MALTWEYRVLIDKYSHACLGTVANLSEVHGGCADAIQLFGTGNVIGQLERTLNRCKPDDGGASGAAINA